MKPHRKCQLDVFQFMARFPLHLAASLPGMARHSASAPGFLDPDMEAHLLDSTTPQYGGSGKDVRLDAGGAFPLRKLSPAAWTRGTWRKRWEARPWGVDACSRLESHPGKKDRCASRNLCRRR